MLVQAYRPTKYKDGFRSFRRIMMVWDHLIFLIESIFVLHGSLNNVSLVALFSNIVTNLVTQAHNISVSSQDTIIDPVMLHADTLAL